jgi:hypothetical protein
MQTTSLTPPAKDPFAGASDLRYAPGTAKIELTREQQSIEDGKTVGVGASAGVNRQRWNHQRWNRQRP